MIDLFQPGAYARAAGGNLERPDLQKPVISWMAWSINSDNGGGGGMAVWAKCRALWNGAGIQDFPWMHVRSMDDLDRLLQVGNGQDSPAIGLNLEDVVADKLDLAEVGKVVQARWQKPVHMATLCWVQNQQGWQHLSFVVAALEMFFDEVPVCQDVQGCIDHAIAEGLPNVTLMLKTKPPNAPETYGDDFSICHSLYTADDILPTATAWNLWKAPTPCEKINPDVPLPPLTVRQVPFTGPKYGPGLPEGGKKSPTAEALKRAMSHLGFIPWTDFDDFYNAVLVEAMKKFQRSVGISPATGNYGKGSWEKLRVASFRKDGKNRYALDPYARLLIQNEDGQQAESEAEDRVQEKVREFWMFAIRNNAAIHYSQNRPFDVSVNPSSSFNSDCSAMVVQALHYAKRETGLDVVDASKNGFSGYGNTDLYEDDWPKVGSPFRIGDLAHYQNSRHVTQCIAAGNWDTSQWGSNGSERAPELISGLRNYRFDDFMFVVRPPLLNEPV